MKKIEFVYNGYKATILMPDNFNGKWVWKTEFFYAFDRAEQALFERGFARVYYCISNKYGSDKAIRLMRDFQKYIVKEYGLEEKAILFGFSRGGLYAFNYALYYPEYVERVYLDAPVLDLKSWPPKDSPEQAEMFEEYCLNADTLLAFKGNPIDNMEEFFSHGIPLLIVAGGADEVVAFEENAQKVIAYCKAHNIPLEYYVKETCGHHPHSLEDVQPILSFCNIMD